MKRAVSLLVLGLGLASGTAATAQDIYATTRGAYTEGGTFGTRGSGTGDGNFLTGISGGDTFHSFFVFDVPGSASTAGSATLNFTGLGAHASGAGPFTLSLYDYTGSVSALTGNTGGVAAFDDLANGVSYGTASLNGLANSYTLHLNADGVAAIKNAAGGQFVVGGALPGAAPENYVFGFTGRNASVALDFAPPAPEPATWALMLVGVGVAGFGLRRRTGRARQTA